MKLKDTLDDVETLGANKTDLGDHFTFDDQVHEKDTATDNLSIVIGTHGLVAPGEQADSTETLTLTGTSHLQEDEDDPGTEDDPPLTGG